jgi:hypothetical protein
MLVTVVRSATTSTRKLRKELTYELAKLRGLELSADETADDVRARALALEIRDQAEICLAILDQYESSVPGPAWSYAETKCQPLREELKRTEMFFRTASGEMERRSGENI